MPWIPFLISHMFSTHLPSLALMKHIHLVSVLFGHPFSVCFGSSLKGQTFLGRLGGAVVKRLPSAQGVIPAVWDRAPHQAPPLGACFFLSHSPCLCSLSRWLSLSSK